MTEEELDKMANEAFERSLVFMNENNIPVTLENVKKLGRIAGGAAADTMFRNEENPYPEQTKVKPWYKFW